MKLIVLLHVFISVSVLFAADTEIPYHASPNRNYDIHHIQIDIQVNIHDKQVKGTVTHYLSPLRSDLTEISLDAESMEIHSVTMLGGSPLNYEMEAKKVIIKLEKSAQWEDTLEIKIDYTANPKTGLHFVLPDSIYPDKRLQAWTQGENMDNHHWVPLYDYPNDMATSEVILTVDSNLVGLSNGALLNIIDLKNGYKTYHWKENSPHVSYLISFVVGNYIKVEDSYEDLPVNYWVYPGDEEKAWRSFRKTPDMIKYFSQLTGVDYPYEKYDQVVIDDFMWGGMENISLTHNTDRTLYDMRAFPDHSSEGLVAHELAHQWYGDLLTTRNWANIWLNEGFATFFSLMYQYKDLGFDEGEFIRYGQIQKTLAADRKDRRPTIDYHYESASNLFTAHVYDKGSVILNMLRHILGEEGFWLSISEYTRQYAHKNVETTDFKRVIEETTGQNLDWFFTQWLYTEGIPEFELDWSYNRWKKIITLNVKQAHNKENIPYFKIPVTILIDTGEITRKEVWLESGDVSFQFESDKKPKMVIFDEGNVIPKRVRSEKAINELMYQAQYSPGIIDRINAIRELGKKKSKPKISRFLLSVAKTDEFWGVRLWAVRAYSKVTPDKGAEKLVELFHEQDNRVKRKCLQGLKKYKGNSFASDFLVQIIQDNLEGYYVIAEAVDVLALVAPKKFDELFDTIIVMDSHKDVIRKSGLAGLGAELTDDHYEKLLQFVQYGGTTWDARPYAVSALAKYGKLYPKITEQAVLLLNDPDYDVRKSAVGILQDYGKPSHVTDLEKLLVKDASLTNDIMEAMEWISYSHDDSNQDSLRKENVDLKKKLSRIQSILDEKEK